MRQREAWDQINLLIGVRRSPNVVHTNQIQLLADANLPNDVHLLVLGEVIGLKICSSGVGGRVDLVGLNVQAQAQELLQIPSTGLGGVVGDKEQLLALRLEEVQGLWDTVNEGVPLPDHPIAVKHEAVGVVNEGGLLCFSDKFLLRGVRGHGLRLCGAVVSSSKRGLGLLGASHGTDKVSQKGSREQNQEHACQRGAVGSSLIEIVNLSRSARGVC
mmetsp:Transcript_42330/g.75848  ORF Transcript_42330/g.75848 Transcript_42330/m.75848 type:complete len:216 (+) Transcript_42330:1191-1838(+)